MRNAQTKALTQPDTRALTLGLGVATGVLLALAPISAKGETTVSHGYSNFGELKYGPDFKHLDYVNPDAPKGGEISTWAQGSFDSFNLATRKGTPAANTTIGYETVLVKTADDPYGMYCLLCETMEYPDDLSWIIFNLRDDVRFQNGTPLTAEDIAFTFNLFLEKGIAEYRERVKGYIDTVEVLGPLRIKFTFSDSAPLNERVEFAGGTYAFSKKWFEDTGTTFDDRSDAPFMSTGPYVLGDFDYGREVSYVRDESYWGADHPLQIGQNNFDTIRTVYFADATAAMEGFTAGAYTFRTENSSNLWATAYDFPNLTNGHVVKAALPNGNVGASQNFVFNLSRTEWQDARVREAFGLMFNFEWSNEALFYGLYARVNSFWPGTDLAATGAPSPEEVALLKPFVDQGLLDASILTDEVIAPPVHDASKNQPSRKQYRAAGALLDEAGWEIGANGIREKDGETLDVVFLTYSPLFDRIINPVVENMKRLGVNAKLERVDIPQYIERLRAGDFDMTTDTIQMSFEPGAGLEQWFHSRTASDSSRNVMRLSDPAIDAILPLVTQAKTLDELKTAARVIDRVLISKRLTIPQWYKNTHTVAYYDMYQHPDPLPPLALGTLSFWWHNAEKADALKKAGVLK